MADLLAKGEAWLAKQQRRFASQKIRYARADSVVTVLATIGRTEHDLDDRQGGTIRIESRDFLIFVNELKLDGVPCVPAGGDRITEGDDVFEVMREPVWTWSDPNRNRYRIHTTLVQRDT